VLEFNVGCSVFAFDRCKANNEHTTLNVELAEPPALTHARSRATRQSARLYPELRERECTPAQTRSRRKWRRMPSEFTEGVHVDDGNPMK